MRRFSTMAGVLLLAGCSWGYPIKAVICPKKDIPGIGCKDAARFKTRDDCETYLKYTLNLCRADGPGREVCDLNYLQRESLVTGHCTE